MAFAPLSLLLLSLLLLASQTLAQTPTAPAPSPGPINITDNLVKGGQYNTWIRLLTVTQVGSQIDNQVNNSNQGMTVFCPTDNAFNSLPTGTLNNLTTQEQVQLVLYHVLPQYYTLADLLTVSNPVHTQASGQEGEVFGLYFSGQDNQVNVSTRIMSTPVNNFLREKFPLAMYEVDKVLMPEEFTESPAPAPAPAAAAANTSSPSATKSTTTTAAESNGSGRLGVGFGLVAGLGLFCTGLLS
ncbi:hypothetical protein RHSIM_Rhsim06G0135900 [Rhododendron simsii]|uniref:FAS1 domain-containing protein n=1 Tax=Rhododendron simsii TaxID=118357 RepID=A0A834GQL2_RHOSS|nr:hypothetical protein RHSIM_Rhsim06G0135900 [Rhododendron simsii]